MKMNISRKYVRRFAAVLCLPVLMSCGAADSVVKLQPGAKGVKIADFPQDFDMGYSHPESHNTVILPNNDFITVRRVSFSMFSGSEYALVKYNGESLMPIWSVPVFLEKNEGVYSITTSGNQINVMTMWDEGYTDVRIYGLSVTSKKREVKLKLKQFDLATGASTGVKDILQIPEWSPDYNLTLDTAGSKMLICYYDSRPMDETSGFANIMVLDNFNLLKSDTITYTTNTLYPAIDSKGNVYTFTTFEDEDDDEKLSMKAVKYGFNGGKDEITIDLPVENIRGDNAFIRSYETRMISDNVIFLTGERGYKEMTRSYIGLQFDFAAKKADVAMNLPLTEEQMETFTGSDDITYFPIIHTFQLPNNENLMVLQGKEYASRGSSTLPQYSGGLILALDNKGGIKWHKYFGKEGRGIYGAFNEARVLPVIMENNLIVMMRDRNNEKGFLAHSIDIANGNSKELNLPFIMENEGNGVYFMRDKTIRTTDDNIILFTKDGLNDTSGKIIKIDMKQIN